MIIYHHSDFDGAVSAAIFYDFLKNHNGYTKECTFIPINYPSVETCHKPGDEFAVLDFQYVDGATWFFDHHRTSFKDESFKNRIDGKKLFWDPDAKSNVSLVCKSLFEVYGYFKEFSELLKWSNIIDSAGYESAEQALDYSIPALKIHAALFYSDNSSNFTVSEFIKYLLEFDFDLQKISQLQIVSFLAKEAEAKLNYDMNAYSRFLETYEYEKVITWDTSNYQKNANRFIPFYLKKRCYYSIGIRRPNGSYEIAYGKNPWNINPSIIDTGKTMKDWYGGGGHMDVAGATFKDYNSARQAQTQLIEYTINKIRSETY